MKKKDELLKDSEGKYHSSVECHADEIDVTSSHRPDTDWIFTDDQGHVHRWFVNGKPATGYYAGAQYSVPTIEWKKTGTSYYEDGEPYETGYEACRECGQRVEPGFTADEYRQYIAGLKHYVVDGREVPPEEFFRLFPQFKPEAP